MSESILDYFKKKQERLLNDQNFSFMRPYFVDMDMSARGNLLIGPRGTGKTTFLISMLKKKKEGLYLSLDDLKILNENLFDLVELAYNEGMRNLFLDEVHYYKNWSQYVKNIYDSFPKLNIILSDSSSLILRMGTGDLSRRFPKSTMPLLSFREYIFFKKSILLPKMDPIKLYKGKDKIQLPKEIKQFIQSENINKIFLEFLEQGQRPFFIEGKYPERIENIIEKTIYSDIPYFLPSLQKNHLNGLKSIISYLANATIPTINIQNLCNQWEMGKDKVYELLSVLEASGITQIIYNTATPKGSSKGDKILFQDCSFYPVLGSHKGNRREAYFASTLKSAGYSVITSSDEEKGDYVVDKILFEVGGHKKVAKKSDIVIKETLDDIYSKEWPLWVLGFLW